MPPDVTEDAMADWWDRVRDQFGDDFEIAQSADYGLIESFGISYLDLRLSNLRVR